MMKFCKVKLSIIAFTALIISSPNEAKALMPIETNICNQYAQIIVTKYSKVINTLSYAHRKNLWVRMEKDALDDHKKMFREKSEQNINLMQNEINSLESNAINLALNIGPAIEVFYHLGCERQLIDVLLKEKIINANIYLDGLSKEVIEMENPSLRKK